MSICNPLYTVFLFLFVYKAWSLLTVTTRFIHLLSFYRIVADTFVDMFCTERVYVSFGCISNPRSTGAYSF